MRLRREAKPCDSHCPGRVLHDPYDVQINADPYSKRS